MKPSFLNNRTVQVLLAIIGTVGITAGGSFLLTRSGVASPDHEMSKPRLDLYQPDGSILKKGNDSLQEIAITFDDGPYPESMNQILDALREQGVKASFFLVGKHVRQYPDLVRRIVQEGHEVGNHSYSHPRLTELPFDLAQKEIKDCENAIVDACGVKPKLFRPPGMKFNKQILDELQTMGYVTISWTNACKDFEIEDNGLDNVTPEVLADRLLTRMGNGAILLLHNTQETANALPLILVKLRAMGYKFVRVSEMLEHLPQPVSVR